MALELIWTSLVAVTAAVASGIFAVIWLTHRASPRLFAAADADAASTVFLVERGEVVDASAAAAVLVDSLASGRPSLDQLLQWLSESFPDVSDALAALADKGGRTVIARDGIGRLEITRTGSRIRFALTDDENARLEIDRVCQTALQTELATLRDIGESLPYAVWRQDRDGRIRWVNRAYLDLLSAMDGRDASAWPPQPVFDEDIRPGVHKRVRCQNRWFDCRAVPVGAETLVSAVPADALVAAERALDTFRQTISRTFAHLNVGLAIFDADRRLAVFNPALTDLTTLPVDILIGRPTLESFLDALRARNMMPEPRDYPSWRDKVADVERASRNGTYSELWHLPGTRTYRITGQPQPDGAVALLMEDISGELDLTRRFRAQIETGQAALDALEDAIAVFDDAGTLTLSNAAYDELWERDPGDGLAHLTLDDALATWRDGTGAEPFWDPAARDATDPGWREARQLRLADGRLVTLTRKMLPANAMMVRFKLHDANVDTLMPRERSGRRAGLKKA